MNHSLLPVFASTVLAAGSLALSAVARAQSPMQAKPTPEMQAVLDELAALDGKPIETITAKEARRQPTPADAVANLMKKAKLKPEKVGDVDNRSIEGPAGVSKSAFTRRMAQVRFRSSSTITVAAS